MIQNVEKYENQIRAIFNDKCVQPSIKATYVYILTFYNNKAVNRETLRKALTIGNNNTLSKHLQILIDRNYLTVIQSHEHGRFQKNRYIIVERSEENNE